MASFENMIGKWETKGTWSSGKNFHQVVEYAWQLTGKIVVAKTYDYVDATQYDNSMRNYGIRAFNDQTKTLHFFDADVHGGVVSGTCTTESNNVYYTYDYVIGGKTQQLTDAWIYTDKDTYQFKVGIYKNGSWEKEFLTSIYKRIK